MFCGGLDIKDQAVDVPTEVQITPIQAEILEILKETGGLKREDLLERLGGRIDRSQLDREFATLRHMEKVRGEKRDGKLYVRLW